MQTTSGDELLQSAGMIYIDATANGETLTLNENSSLFIELPTNIKESGFSVFTGKHDEKGNINWQEENPIHERMIPLPLKELDISYHTSYRYPMERVAIQFIDSIVIDNLKYENTYIATLEFKERLERLNSDDWQWWEGYESYMNEQYLKKDPAKDGSIWKKYMAERGKTFKIHCTALEIYLNNTDKPLWFVDSLVYDFLLKAEIRDSIKYYTYEEWSGTNQIWYPSYPFKYFYEQRLTDVKKFDPRGVDMTKQNAKEKLVNKGYTEEEAFEQILIYDSRKKIIKQLQDAKRIQDERKFNQDKISKAFSKSFSVKKLGWINVDQFYNDPNAREVEFTVQTINDSVDFCDLTLLLPRKSIAINGIPMGKNKYRFTKEDKQYRKLPVGESGFLIAMSSKNGSPYFAFLQIKIEEKNHIELLVNKSSWKEIDSVLTRLN